MNARTSSAAQRQWKMVRIGKLKWVHATRNKNVCSGIAVDCAMLVQHRKHILIIICYYLLLYFDLAFVRNSSSTHFVSVHTTSARLLFAGRCVSPAAYLIHFGRRIVSVNACVYTSFVRVLLSLCSPSIRCSPRGVKRWMMKFVLSIYYFMCDCVCRSRCHCHCFTSIKIVGPTQKFSRAVCVACLRSRVWRKKKNYTRSVHTHDKLSTQHTIRSKNNNHFLKFLSFDCVYLSLAVATATAHWCERALSGCCVRSFVAVSWSGVVCIIFPILRTFLLSLCWLLHINSNNEATKKQKSFFLFVCTSFYKRVDAFWRVCDVC